MLLEGITPLRVDRRYRLGERLGQTAESGGNFFSFRHFFVV